VSARPNSAPSGQPADADSADPGHGGLPPSAEEGQGWLAWMARNHVAANLLMLLFLLGGALQLMRIKVESFPAIDPRTITVNVPYPGASPAEVEEGINRRIEEAITGIEGIKRVRSSAREGAGLVTAELEDRANDRKVLDDIKSAVERLQNFPPEDALDVSIAETENVERVVTLVLYGDVPERTLKELANQVRDEVTALPELSLATVTGTRPYEIAVELSEEQLRAKGLSFEEVAQAVARFSVNLPGGGIRTRAGEVLLRTDAQAYVREDFEGLVLRTTPGGERVLLRDVATIVDGFEDTDVLSLFQGKPAVYVNVSRVGEQRLIDIARRIESYAAELRLPAGVEAELWASQSEMLESRLELMLRNGLFGLLLVFLTLLLFMDLKLAFWTTLGIPVSFLGAFLVIGPVGGSINMISLFGLIIVLGIVVDDAIVVGEAVFAYRQQGLSPLAAAIRGVRQMAGPVSAGVLTTVAAFLPLAYTTGFMGQVLWQVPVVVVSVLLVSLIEALFILPAHLASGRIGRPRGFLPVIQERLRLWLELCVERIYLPTLRVALRWRYVCVALAASLLLLVGGLVRGGHVPLVFFPPVDSDTLKATVEMPVGSPAEVTVAAVQRLLVTAEELRAEIDAASAADGPSILRSTAATVGTRAFEDSGPPGAGAQGVTGSNLGEVTLELLPGERRKISSSELERRWQTKVGEIPGATRLSFNSNLLRAGDDVSVELSHADQQSLLQAVAQLKERLSGFSGVSEIADSFDAGKRELRLALSAEGEAAGLSLAELARQVRRAFYGQEAQRVQRGRDDIKVMVRYTEDERRNLGSIYRMRIRLPDGTETPFRTVASVEEGRGYSVIERADRRRVVRVTAKVDAEIQSANQLNAQLKQVVLPQMQTDLPGLGFSFEGVEQERLESLQSLMKLMGVALLAIFALIAVQLSSYIQPLLIMSVIPFGIIGAVLGHVLTGYTLSFFSFFGLVALCGVVVNDSLVLMDGFNAFRATGLSTYAALVQAAQRRFRPILFTTLTTFAGLAPMMLEKSVQAQFLIPMAISLAYGVVFATGITLVLVPCLTLIVEDLGSLAQRMIGRPAGKQETASGTEAVGEVLY
jgi:multidrug efflux pump subunit AcrB